jgi:pilus assembly protein CpaC
MLRLSPGHQQVVPSPNVRRAAIGDPKVADVKALPESGQVIVTGIAPGSTDLILWLRSGEKRSYAIQVSSQGRSTLEEIRKLLEGVEGVEVKPSGGRVILDGQIFRNEDLERVRKILTLHPSVVDLTRMNPATLEYMSRRVTAALERAGLSSVRVSQAGDTLFLEGEVARKEDASRALRVATSVYGDVSNHLTVGIEPAPLILVDVKLMEIRKNSLRQAGIGWPPAIEALGTMTVSGSGAAVGATITQKGPVSLMALVERGQARILANPRLLCRSGSPASFLAGGEIPIRLVSERNANVFFKPYGMQLDVTARADRSGRILMEIDAKISDLDTATSAEGVPGILEHHVKTSADLKTEETVVLGGLIENRAAKNVSKVPFLGHIPVLGELFKSRAFTNNESEFLVFLTPKPGNPSAMEPKIQLERSKALLRRADEELKLSILD